MIEALARQSPFEEWTRDIPMHNQIPAPRGSAAPVVRVEPIVPGRWIVYVDDFRKARVFAIKNLALVYARRLAVANPASVALATCE